MGNYSATFKKYKRGTRVQISDEKFGSGMQSTTTPLLDGYVKQMVNYDTVDASNESISPRAGLITVNADLHTGAIAYNSDMLLIDGKLCYEEDSNTYNQIVLGQVTDTQITDAELYKGTGYVGTGDSSALALTAMQTGSDAILFKKPTSAVIHNISITDLDNIAKHVGTFAFNNDYYYFKDTGKLCKSKFSTGTYSVEEVIPKTITPKEAVMWGYNMLSTTPYTFTNTISAGVIQLLGLLPYAKGTSNLIMSPYVNQEITLEAFYAVGSGLKYDVQWDWKELGSAVWTTIKTETLTLTAGSTIKCDFSCPTPNIMVRITATGYTGATKNSYPDQVLTVGMSFNKAEYGSTANVATTAYSIYTSTGMCYWKNRLVTWGVKEDQTIMFTSDVNDPSYFTYPQGAEVFDEAIIHCLPYGDDLLVFTTTKLYQIRLNTDGLSWTKKLIQSNLYITPWDVHLIQPVKNMVFFKSGNYYYMVVPSSKTVTGLSIAPIHKTIKYIFDNFQTYTATTIQDTYGYIDTLELIHYYNYLDFEDIHNVYVFKTTDNLYINYVLLYNVTNRSWREYLFESQHVVKPFEQDATKKGTLMSLFNFNSKPSIQYLQYSTTSTKDVYLPDGLTSLDDATTTFEAMHKYGNYQLLDTGLREHESDFKKRYREVQLKVNNTSQQALKFYTEITVDGETRKSMDRYVVHHEVDPQNPNYGLITMERELVDPTILPGATILAEDDTQDQYWTLDSSLFPDIYLWKIRIPISGKGYAPRLKLVSYNEEQYELLNISWVYRPLYSR